jgi:hypothetical protein
LEVDRIGVPTWDLSPVYWQAEGAPGGTITAVTAYGDLGAPWQQAVDQAWESYVADG